MSIFEKSSWIWLDGFDKVNAYAVFYDKATIDNTDIKYIFRISVDTNYALYINGKFITSGQYADYPFDKVYDELDVTEHLANGENSIVISCYHQGDDSSTVRAEKAGLIYELISEDGKTVLTSSVNTKACPDSRYAMGNTVEHISGQLGYTFRYDSTALLPEAVQCVAVDKPMPKRVRPIKKLIIGDNETAIIINKGWFKENGGGTVGQRMQYAALASNESNVRIALPNENGVKIDSGAHGDGIFVLIDTGCENAGILSLDLDVPKDAEILVGWGEHLEDLQVRSYIGGRNFAASYKAHAGKNVFVNPFRRLGMRYMQLHIYSETVTIRYAGIKTTDYPMSHDVMFTCADSLHNRIYEICKRTLLMSVHEHYEDCPWREQALYSMDSRNQMLCGYYSFKEYDFAKASIRLMAQSIREDNLLELCSPARVSITIPAFTAIFLTQVYEYLKYSGDKAFITEMLPYMKRIADGFIEKTKNDKGLLTCYTESKHWNFYEWQSGLEGSISGSISDENITYDAPLCAFVSFGLRSYADVLEIMGDASAEYYRECHLKLNAAIDNSFWDEDKHSYASYINKKGERYHFAELTNSLIAYADAAVGERLDDVQYALSNDKLLPVTLSHSIFKYDVLMKNPEKYSRYVFGDIADKWGHMLYNKATTFWETIEGAEAFGNAGSLCHGWSAIPVYFYHRYALELNGEVTGLYECKVSE